MKPYYQYKTEKELINEINICTDTQATILLINTYIDMCDYFFQVNFVEDDEEVYEHYLKKLTRLSDLKEQLNTENELVIINQIKEIINEKSE